MSSGEKVPELDIILKRIKELEQEIEKLRAAGVERKEKEDLLKELKNIVSVSREENVINIRISATARSAIFRLKRGVWATINKLQKSYKDQFDLGKSKTYWGRIASLIVKKINAAKLSEYPTKIIMTYDVVMENGKYVFKPKEARILVFEPSAHILATMDEASQEEIIEIPEEKEKIE